MLKNKHTLNFKSLVDYSHILKTIFGVQILVKDDKVKKTQSLNNKSNDRESFCCKF